MKVALGVEYFGKNFHGWQIQKSGLRTVQSVVEFALSQVANHQVRVFCSGRTDSGVHAVEQVIHFETNTIRTERAWLFGGNVNLPSDVNFKWVKVVSDDFHARFSTVARSYKYKIHHNPVRSSLKADYFLWEPRSLNIDDMKDAAVLLLSVTKTFPLSSILRLASHPNFSISEAIFSWLLALTSTGSSPLPNF